MTTATTIAIAGGTGSVGRSFLEEFQRHDRYKVIVLTRSEPSHAIDSHGTEYIRASYDDADVLQLAGLLRKKNVHTVISAIGITTEETRDAQLNLIRAAIQANDVTKRFIPSEFGCVYLERMVSFDPTTAYWIEAAKLLSASPLTYTRVVNGFFLDYYGMPNVESTLSPFTWALDMTNHRAAIPGDGEKLISFTLVADVARYIVKLVDLAVDGQEWDEWSIVVGEDTTFNNFLALAEQATGSKFETVYESREKLGQGEATIFPLPGKKEVDWDMEPWGGEEGVKQYLSLFGVMYEEGILHVPTEGRLSDKYRKELPVTKIEEFLNRAWKRN